MDGRVNRTKPQLGGGDPTAREMLDHATLCNGGPDDVKADHWRIAESYAKGENAR